MYTCPAANIKPKPNNMNIVDFVRSKKEEFSFGASWGAASGAGLAYSGYENYVDVGSSMSFWYNIL